MFVANQDVFTKALKLTADALVLPKMKFAVAVNFTGDEEIKQLNSDFRHKDKATNVLSFPMIDDFSELEKMPFPHELGDIVLAYETIHREALQQGKTPRDHTIHLLVHGMLHLFGYDHMNKKEEREMEALEIDILAKLKIANPY